MVADLRLNSENTDMPLRERIRFALMEQKRHVMWASAVSNAKVRDLNSAQGRSRASRPSVGVEDPIFGTHVTVELSKTLPSGCIHVGGRSDCQR